jgi:hypothetical protein
MAIKRLNAYIHPFIYCLALPVVCTWRETWKPHLARTARCDYFMGRRMMSTVRMYARAVRSHGPTHHPPRPTYQGLNVTPFPSPPLIPLPLSSLSSLYGLLLTSEWFIVRKCYPRSRPSQ